MGSMELPERINWLLQRFSRQWRVSHFQAENGSRHHSRFRYPVKDLLPAWLHF
jgi:hypothetical protein